MGGKKPPLAGGDGEESLRGQLARLTRLPFKSHHTAGGLGKKLPNLFHALVAAAWTWPLPPIGYTLSMCHLGCAFACLELGSSPDLR